ncbi:MAG: hypothetical protein ABR562_04100 [Thermoplasmatota archaeon]|nr:hypothetical protein [Halobacteriales archaeon]
MVSMRAAAFVLGALGLALFLGGILWALFTPPDASCHKAKACERESYGKLLTNVMFVVGGGLVLEAAAVVMLLTHLTKGRAPPPRQAGPPPPPPPPGTPRNRFLEPPVRRPASARKP